MDGGAADAPTHAPHAPPPFPVPSDAERAAVHGYFSVVNPSVHVVDEYLFDISLSLWAQGRCVDGGDCRARPSPRTQRMDARPEHVPRMQPLRPCPRG